uniref:Uncharacterized protein n=1 Tax=Arundo donax TaxID=35708 RepID=A0A0A9CB14_ARUDO
MQSYEARVLHLGTRTRGTRRGVVSPGASPMSRSAGRMPAGSSQSKWRTRLTSASSTTGNAKLMPGQILRPAPNGMSW